MEPIAQSGLVFEIGGLYAQSQSLNDFRKRRRLRYELALTTRL